MLGGSEGLVSVTQWWTRPALFPGEEKKPSERPMRQLRVGGRRGLGRGRKGVQEMVVRRRSVQTGEGGRRGSEDVDVVLEAIYGIVQRQQERRGEFGELRTICGAGGRIRSSPAGFSGTLRCSDEEGVSMGEFYGHRADLCGECGKNRDLAVHVTAAIFIPCRRFSLHSRFPFRSMHTFRASLAWGGWTTMPFAVSKAILSM
jgi:hypothetical protein